jgi:glycosyltransferase involved in cell wall biosynthesis
LSDSPSPSATPPVDGPVLMVSSSFPRWHGDAAGHFVARLAGALVERGVAVRALVPHEAGAARRETLAGVEVTRLRYFRPERLQRLAYGSGVPANLRRRPVAWLNLPFFLAAFLGAIARSGGRHRLLHAHWGVLGALAVLTRPIHRRPVVVTVHGSDLHPEVAPLGVRRLTRLAIRRSDAVLTPSAAFERECRTIGARDSRFVPHGVDSPDASRLAEVLAARRERAERGSPLRLVTVGRLVPERRHDLLLAALAGVAPPAGGSELVVVGEGPERRRIEERARELAPAWRVQLVGQVAPDSILELLAGADLYVSATSVETFGLATVEAAGCALPIVATAVGYPAELLAPDAARLVPVADVESLRAAIEPLSSDPGTRLALGHRARDRFDRAELSWESAAERTAAVYREVLERGNGHG